MINEHDMTKKMLNLIREAEGIIGDQPNNQPQTGEVVNTQSMEGPVNNIAISGVLPSGIEFTMNYKENLGVTFTQPDTVKLDAEIPKDLAQLMQLQKTFRDKWNERDANTTLGKKQLIIYRLNNGQREFGPDNSQNWYNEDIKLFTPVSDDITFTSYIINP